MVFLYTSGLFVGLMLLADIADSLRRMLRLHALYMRRFQGDRP